MSNLTILERNTILCFQESPESELLYLRGSQRNELKAFKMALEWRDQLEPFMDSMVNAARELYPTKAVEEVREFIKERHYRRYFPQGRAA